MNIIWKHHMILIVAELIWHKKKNKAKKCPQKIIIAKW